MLDFKPHLDDSNMSYWYHFKHSFKNGLTLLKLAMSSFIHAIFPNILPQHAARGVISIYNNIRHYKHLRKVMIEMRKESKVK